MTEWHQDEGFWADFGDVMFTPQRFAGAESEVASVVELLELLPPGPVLDLCCGPGRHTLELARLGYEVTGVDSTAAYVERARRAIADAGLQADLVHADARGFRRPGAYAAAILMYTSLGFFADPEDDVRMLHGACESLRPGGALVVDLRGKEMVAGGFEPRTWDELDGGELFLREVQLTGPWTGIRTRWILVGEDGARRERSFHLRLYSGAELEAALRRAGFDQVDLHGDLDGGPYDLDATRLVAVARRGG